MADHEEPFFDRGDLAWAGVGVVLTILAVLSGFPLLGIAWFDLVAAGFLVWFALARRDGLPIWPAMVLGPLLLVVPMAVASWSEDDWSLGDLFWIVAALVAVGGIAGVAELLANRVERHDEARVTGGLDEEAHEEVVRRDLRWIAILAVACLGIAVAFAWSTVRDGDGWWFLLFGLAPVVVPSVWEWLRKPKGA